MDSAHNGTRKFPAYTTVQLKAAVAQYEAGTHPCGKAPEDHLNAIKAEIAAREAGTSVVFRVPSN